MNDADSLLALSEFVLEIAWAAIVLVVLFYLGKALLWSLGVILRPVWRLVRDPQSIGRVAVDALVARVQLTKIGLDELLVWSVSSACGYALLARGDYWPGGVVLGGLAIAIALRMHRRTS